MKKKTRGHTPGARPGVWGRQASSLRPRGLGGSLYRGPRRGARLAEILRTQYLNLSALRTEWHNQGASPSGSTTAEIEQG